MLIQGISIIILDQIPNYLVFQNVLSMLASNVSTVLTPSVTTLKNDKAKFKKPKNTICTPLLLCG